MTQYPKAEHWKSSHTISSPPSSLGADAFWFSSYIHLDLRCSALARPIVRGTHCRWEALVWRQQRWCGRQIHSLVAVEKWLLGTAHSSTWKPQILASVDGPYSFRCGTLPKNNNKLWGFSLPRMSVITWHRYDKMTSTIWILFACLLNCFCLFRINNNQWCLQRFSINAVFPASALPYRTTSSPWQPEAVSAVTLSTTLLIISNSSFRPKSYPSKSSLTESILSDSIFFCSSAKQCPACRRVKVESTISLIIFVNELCDKAGYESITELPLLFVSSWRVGSSDLSLKLNYFFHYHKLINILQVHC